MAQYLGNTLLRCMLILIYFNLVRGPTETTSQDGGTECIGQSWSPQGRAVLARFTLLDIPPGQYLRTFSAYFCEDRPLILQIWRADGDGDFILDWFYRMDPPDTTPGPQTITIAEDESLLIQQTHRWGLYVPGLDNATIPISMFFLPYVRGAIYPSRQSSNSYQLGSHHYFEDIPWPYFFLLQLCHMPDCSLPETPEIPDYDEDGNECADDTLLVSRGTAVVRKSYIPPPMEAQAVEAYFCLLQPVYLQLWWPESSTSYRLLWQIMLEPPLVVDSRKVTNLPPGQELQVNSSMRLGLWTPVSSTGGLTEIPISTLWRPSEGQFVRSFESDNFLVGEDYQFDSLEYPYDFRVDFCPYPDCLDPTTPPPSTDVTSQAATTSTKTTLPDEIIPSDRTTEAITFGGEQTTAASSHLTETRTDSGITTLFPTAADRTDTNEVTASYLSTMEDRQPSVSHGMDDYSTPAVTGVSDSSNTTEMISDMYDDITENPSGRPDPSDQTTDSMLTVDTETTSTDASVSIYSPTMDPTNNNDTVNAISTDSDGVINFTFSTTHIFASNASSPLPTTVLPGYIVDIRGPKGPLGSVGPLGPVGPQGPSGPKGDTGSPGVRGQPGLLGETVKGEPGLPGEPGIPGVAGRPGGAGPPGAMGRPGTKGSIGDQGTHGQDGISHRAVSGERCECPVLLSPSLLLGLIAWSVILSILLLIMLFMAAKQGKQKAWDDEDDDDDDVF